MTKLSKLLREYIEVSARLDQFNKAGGGMRASSYKIRVKKIEDNFLDELVKAVIIRTSEKQTTNKSL